ncbi:DUF1850 domain-containing protein [Sutcliffiella halmapala]|uniref:DUF1850 domain-containing protein n=1 Tax=Sutcliffiella halmapala TaxID=79882 RepID=UPI000994DBD5|nr:DUF1850 domain-containing protein [Sutcliffiella halmapala]
MNDISKRRMKVLLASCSTLLLFVLLFVPIQTALVFYVKNTNQIHAFLPIDEEDHFQIIFKHSIHLTDVVEKYQVLNTHEILQYEIIYEEFGIGMPSNAEEGAEFVYEDGKYHIKHLQNIFPYINIRNGKTVSEHRLLWGTRGEKIISFNDYFTPGSWYKVKVEKLSLWQYMKGMKIHE